MFSKKICSHFKLFQHFCFSGRPKTILPIAPTTTASPDRFTFRMMLFHEIFPDERLLWEFFRHQKATLNSNFVLQHLPTDRSQLPQAHIRITNPIRVASFPGPTGNVWKIVREEKISSEIGKVQSFFQHLFFFSILLWLPAWWLYLPFNRHSLTCTLSPESNVISPYRPTTTLELARSIPHDQHYP